MGYTPSFAVGVWVGNNNNTAMKNRADGSIVAGPIWNAFMKRALEGTPVEQFEMPDIHPTGKPVLDGSLGSQTLVIDRASGKLATDFTPDTFKETRVYGGYHEILQFVVPNNPQGSAPDHPEQDPMYAAFESGVQNWINKKQQETGIQLVTTNPPSDQDDIHIPSNSPTILIQSPSNNTIIDGHTLPLSVSASAPRGIAHIEFYLDDLFIGSINRQPFNTILEIPTTFSKGLHSLKAVAYDDVDNSSIDTVSIQTAIDSQDEIIRLIDPKNDQLIQKNSGSYTIVVSLNNPQSIAFVTIFAEQIGLQNKSVISQFSNPSTPFVTADWILPSAGTWILSVRAKQKSGVEITTAGTVVEVKNSILPSSSNTSGIFNPSNVLNPFEK